MNNATCAARAKVSMHFADKSSGPSAAQKHTVASSLKVTPVINTAAPMPPPVVGGGGADFVFAQRATDQVSVNDWW